MKILFAINDMGIGGAQKAVANQAIYLATKGFQVEILTFFKKEGGASELINKNRLKIKETSFNGYWHWSFWKQLVIFLRTEKFDAIFSALYLSNFIIRVCSFFIPKTRIFIREANMPNEKKFVNKVIDFFLAFKTEKIITPCRAVAQAVAKQEGISVDKFVVVYNGIDQQWINCAKANSVKIRKEYRIGSQDVMIVSVALLYPKKGHRYLLEAMCALLKNKNNVYLFLAGAGPEKNNLENIIKQSHLEERVFLMGLINDSTVRELLCESDIFVLPSLWEGMPNALMEAMAVGRACVATNVGGVAEIIDDGYNGLIVDPYDVRAIEQALTSVVLDEALRKRFADNAKKTMTNYTWEKNGEQLIKLINK